MAIEQQTQSPVTVSAVLLASLQHLTFCQVTARSWVGNQGMQLNTAETRIQHDLKS